MTDKEKLYDTFGELIYTIAMADGEIQEEEVQALHKILDQHPWASQVKWSFNYERGKGNTIDQVYKKVLNICKKIGPSVEYAEMVDIMKKVAESSKGIDKYEQIIIDSFQQDLIDHFNAEIDKLKE